MITGYNTDVKYGSIVLHVQTEDKGQSNPYIESLVYFGGQVVVAKRSSYADLMQAGTFTVEQVTGLMEQQHRTMMKAIHAGKFDDKIRVFVPDKPLGKQSPKTSAIPLDATSGIDLPDDDGRTLDQVILEYLTNESEQEQLVLALEQEIDLKAGELARLPLRTRSSRTGEAVAAAKVNVKMISTFGGPRTLGIGTTDGEGFLEVLVDIPEVSPGTAALIITATSEIGQAELKQLL